MPAPNIDNVRVGLTGGVRTAPVGTTAPTDVGTAYGAGWVELGYLSEDGITRAEDTDVEEIPGWQNGTVVRRVVSSSTTTFAFTVIETNRPVWELQFPGSTFASVTPTGGTVQTTVTVRVPKSNPRAFAFDVVDGEIAAGVPRTYRFVVPRGEVSERGDLVFRNGEPVGYEFTMTCYPASDGTVYTILTNDAAVSA